MKIEDFLSPTDVLIDIQAKDKLALLDDLATRAANSLKLPATSVFDELEKREQLGSTGVGGGIAIPHARLHAIKQPFGMLARLRKPLDFESVDGQPVDIVFLLLLPASSQSEKQHVLATVARKLRDSNLVQQLRRVSDAHALYQVISG